MRIAVTTAADWSPWRPTVRATARRTKARAEAASSIRRGACPTTSTRRPLFTDPRSAVPRSACRRAWSPVPGLWNAAIGRRVADNRSWRPSRHSGNRSAQRSPPTDSRTRPDTGAAPPARPTRDIASSKVAP